MTEAKPSRENQRTILFCHGTGCVSGGAIEIRQAMEKAVAEMGLSTAIANLEGSEQKLEQLRTKAFQDQLNSPALWSARNPNNPEVGGLARRTLGWPCDLAMQSCLGYIPLGCSERRRNRTGIPSAG